MPSPKDLYKYINGDEWVDWIDLYLSIAHKSYIEIQAEEPKYIVESICSISGNLLTERLVTAKRGILKFFNLLR